MVTLIMECRDVLNKETYLCVSDSVQIYLIWIGFNCEIGCRQLLCGCVV